MASHFTLCAVVHVKGKGKVVTYSIRALGPEQIAVCRQSYSPQVTSHKPSGRLPLLSTRPAVTFPAEERHRPLRLWPVPNYTAWWQKHMCVNNLPRVVTWKWNGRDSHPRPLDRESNALTPPCHTIVHMDGLRPKVTIFLNVLFIAIYDRVWYNISTHLCELGMTSTSPVHWHGWIICNYVCADHWVWIITCSVEQSSYKRLHAAADADAALSTFSITSQDSSTTL